MANVPIRANAVVATSLPFITFTRRARQGCVCLKMIEGRNFSTSNRRDTKASRVEFERWLFSIGKKFKRPLPGSTNYMGAYTPRGELSRARRQVAEKGDNANERTETEQRLLKAARGDGLTGNNQLPRESARDLEPFRNNPLFRSQRVLSEDLREAIYLAVAQDGKSVRAVSTEFQVTMERVAAVVRMKQMERDWLDKGKPLAAIYSEQVLNMLPQTTLEDKKHEDINDLPVHPKTTQQIFYPTSESRIFTREDAGKAFSAELLPADQRIPHPELITIARAEYEGKDRFERDEIREKLEEEEKQRLERKATMRAEAESRDVRIVTGNRWDFKFKDISVDNAGKDGRSRRGVGWRYGMPHEDRKPGQVKIPTSVG